MNQTRNGLLGMFLTGSLLLAMMTSSQAQSIFTDIENSWAKASILHMYESGIVNGLEDGRFAPEGKVTREQLIKMIVLATGGQVTQMSAASFADVGTDRWSHDFVETALTRSILSVSPSGKFEPEQHVTRLQAAEWIAKAVPPMNTGIAGGQKAPFSDIRDLTPGAQAAISQVYHLGIMFGDEGIFRPYDGLSRAEAAVLIERLLERMKIETGGQEMGWKRVDVQTAPVTLQQWVKEKRNSAGIYTINLPGKTYILVARGEKPHSGYGIAITKVTEESNRIAVSVKLQEPEPGKMYTQVITYPVDLVEIPQTDKPVELVTPLK